MGNAGSAIGLLQGFSVAFPAWLLVSQFVLRRTKNSQSEIEFWPEFALYTLIIASYATLVFMIQSIYKTLAESGMSSVLLDGIIWFRTWATLSAIVILLIMTRDRSPWYKGGVLLGGIVLALIFHWIVKIDMTKFGM